MTTPSTPHHRFHLQGTLAGLTLDLEAALAAPWTILFGPSGSGKSTLLRALAGLTPQLHATFERQERATSTWSPLQDLPPEHRQLAYAPQHAQLLPHLTAEENIRFPERLRSVPSGGSRVSELTELLHLGPLLPKAPQQLSGGERQRVSLARALAVPQARLLLLDEPFAGFDRNLRDNLIPRFQQYLAARDLPVLSVTHDPDEALLLQADILRLQNGRITSQGSAREALADELARLAALLYREQP